MSDPGDRPGRPPIRWSAIGLVAAGGVAGVACREGLSLAIPEVDDVPIAIVVVNVFGAFLLGLLYEALTRPGVAEGTRTRLKLLIGTGFCGGLTTYSSLATDTAVLASDGHRDRALVFAVSTLVVGGLATWVGIVLGARLARRHADRAAAS